jgi:hypothetical protein
MSMKDLNRLASEAQQFETIYRIPARRKPSPPTSYGLLTPVSPPVSNIRAPSVPTILNRLASDALQFGFVYPDTRDLFSTRRPDFLTVRLPTVRTWTPNDSACLKELNRLARLVELTPHPRVPIYPSFTTITSTFDVNSRNLYTKIGSKAHASNPFSDKLRAKLHLKNDERFIDAFPKTTPPQVELLNGAPIIDRTVFNSLLRIKMQTACQILGTQHLSKNITSSIVHWINTILTGFYLTVISKKRTHISQYLGKSLKQFVKGPSSAEQTERETQALQHDEPTPRPAGLTIRSDPNPSVITSAPQAEENAPVTVEISYHIESPSIPTIPHRVVRPYTAPNAPTPCIPGHYAIPFDLTPSVFDHPNPDFATRELKLTLRTLMAKLRFNQLCQILPAPDLFHPLLSHMLTVLGTEKTNQLALSLWFIQQSNGSLILAAPNPANYYLPHSDTEGFISRLAQLQDYLNTLTLF